VEQATQAATPQPTDTFAHAHTVAGALIAQLSSDELPFAVELDTDFPSGWRVHLKFRANQGRGLLSFAALVDVPVTRATTSFGIHLDAYARVEDIEVRGSALLNPREMAALDAQQLTSAPAPATSEAAVQPVPLGASVQAQVPAVAAPGGAE
jgi:hypothetical protein